MNMAIPREYILCGFLVLSLAVWFSFLHTEQHALRKELELLKFQHMESYKKHTTDILEEMHRMETTMKSVTDDSLAEVIGGIKDDLEKYRADIHEELRRMETKLKSRTDDLTRKVHDVQNSNDRLDKIVFGLDTKVNALKMKELKLQVGIIELHGRHMEEVLQRVMEVFETLKKEIYGLEDDYSELRKDMRNLQRRFGEQESSRQRERGSSSYIVKAINMVIGLFGSYFFNSDYNLLT